MNSAVLQVEDLKTYFFLKRGVVKAVNGVSFSMEKGESLGLVGESGCGKTMTAMSILRLEPKPAGRIVGGRILLDGEDLVTKSKSEMRRIRGGRISIIMQDAMTALNPVYTVGNQLEEIIWIHGQVKGRKHIRQTAIEALEHVGIPAAASRIDNYPHQMSGGMRQRVLGAMTICATPSILIADEPTTALDVTTQAQYLRLLKKIQDETGVGMIFITHDLGIVAKMCDRVCVMYTGKVIESAEVEELWDNPRHPYTVALMKSVPKVKKKSERLYAIEGVVPSPLDLPPGCSFEPRCDRAVDRCRDEAPPEEHIGEGHYVSCWRVMN